MTLLHRTITGGQVEEVLMEQVTPDGRKPPVVAAVLHPNGIATNLARVLVTDI